jgi:hypothetical protein
MIWRYSNVFPFPSSVAHIYGFNLHTLGLGATATKQSVEMLCLAIRIIILSSACQFLCQMIFKLHTHTLT